MLKVGIIGCGEIAQLKYIPYLIELPNFELVAICRRNKKLLDNIANKYNIKKRYTDYNKLLEQNDIDAVIITTFFEHAEITIAAAEHGKHVLVEKPLCFSLQEADEMIKVCQKNNVKLMMAEMKRYDSGYQYAQNVFKDKNIIFIRMHDFLAYSPLITNEMYDIYEPTNEVRKSNISLQQKKHYETLHKVLKTEEKEIIGAYFWLAQTGVHDIEILRGLFGTPKKILFTDIYHPMPGSWDYFITSIMEYDDNIRCIFELGNTRRKWFDEELIAYTPDETLLISFQSPYLKNNPTIVKRKYMYSNEEQEIKVISSYDESFRRELKHFHDCIINNITPITDGIEGRKDIELAIRMIKKYSKNR